MTTKKRIALITGASGGIGHCLAEGFHHAGYQVIALDLQQPQPLADDIVFIKTDLSNPTAIPHTFETVGKTYGAPHVLVNNAAIAHFHKPIQNICLDELNAVFDVNLRGAFLCCQAFVKGHSDQEYGRIINIASTRFQQNEAHWDAYGATKGGLVALTQSLAVSLSDTPITVNAISPGWIETGDYSLLTPNDHAQHPSRRVGKPRDILNACLYLTHPENDFINGANLVVDGGMSKKMIYV